ncbi:hypothetical protein BGZ96_001454 [Linnemannia gamsii]|uniref:Uncharacterized protein n=1 Tax=Linnemannia gamsii TaxID=64522 RepID=A0ABQ7JM89_9FUNG|nr:hypothetical protein BGZ96_001454 [Linnemannia gamsii]
METSKRLTRSQNNESFRHHPTFSFMTALLFTFSLLLLSALITPSLAFPVTLEPRRNPLTIGLGLRGGGIGLNLGGNSLLNFHHRPRNLDKRASLEPGAKAAEKEEVVSSVLEKRSILTGPPTSGAEAESGDTAGGDRLLGDPGRGKYYIRPPSESGPLNDDSESGSVLEKRRLVENRKRQYTPGKSPRSGGNYKNGDPFSRRKKE